MHVRERGVGMEDGLNVPLEDAELLAEVEMTTNLIIAASESDTLTQEQIDRLLGLPAGDDAEAADTGDRAPEQTAADPSPTNPSATNPSANNPTATDSAGGPAIPTQQVRGAAH